ncbi:ATP/GTP-binding protein [Pseudoclavibacter chungangensis]|uniref:ATP/GTP-binding protein n=2 Tax=Pseudoclavibacter chungangensis TaxID=587635 RepID=A0A7J5BZE3_9MICO|nr:ATP/GTP-binding protein [Pseudoclavibacter chungangensis]
MPEKKNELEQHIAVFGESSSGKTVLVSSFYGAAQQAAFVENSLYRVVANDIGQGSRLNRNYLGMRDEATPPLATQFAATSYAFSIKLKEPPAARAPKDQPFDALRLVWHDYPGEWFEQSLTGEEAQRRIDTFRALLHSDVALLLVDGQRLLDHAGEEERYLKSLFNNYMNGLLTLKDDVLVDGKPLVQFPRIWMVALSKADLLPDMDAYAFRDMLDLKAADDINELRSVLKSFVQAPDAMSVGEDFLLLSSGKFEPGKIDLSERRGVDLVLPVASILPLERHARWAKLQNLPGKVAENLLGAGFYVLGAALLGKKFFGKAIPLPLAAALAFLNKDVVDAASRVANDALRDLNEKALAKRNYVTATLTQFQLDLNTAEAKRTLLRSAK